MACSKKRKLKTTNAVCKTQTKQQLAIQYANGQGKWARLVREVMEFYENTFVRFL